MKKTYIKLIVLLISSVFTSCTDVVSVDVPTAQTRLVIEASLDWEKGTTGNNQTIQLSTTTSYFNTTTNSSISGALVKVINTNTAEEFVFSDQNNGTYTTSSFVPILNAIYELEVIYNGETYSATENLLSVSDINTITQSIDGGFDDELLELNVFFDDPANEENYYLIRYFEQGDLFPTFQDFSDEFVNGNEIDTFFEKEDNQDNNETPFEAGDVVDINLHGISERYYNFIRLLIEQYDSGGDPFSSTAAEIRGNCINQTNADNYPYGYFRATEVVKTSYTFQ